MTTHSTVEAILEQDGQQVGIYITTTTHDNNTNPPTETKSHIALLDNPDDTGPGVWVWGDTRDDMLNRASNLRAALLDARAKPAQPKESIR